jgi:VCBS repeat-containing protein
MTYDELVEFLAGTQRYSIAEATAEVESLVSGEWDSLHVTDSEGTEYVISCDVPGETFIVTDNPGH